ncbi:hypothetical protein FQN55_009675 [Onygenales sp. PD_40]|nr:hypothetical protein FQN55_009675 [Onygenales sp. PD_40]KAK2785617.1 hypothetical protein FQN53_007550 [Emmonsiellopsis sp. PD_33]KAK2787665.1 hypothetical protein FQN52_007156 [Onygenales sp. PD_12]
MRFGYFANAGILLASAAHVSARKVKTGLQVLQESNYSQLSGRKVIVLSNPTGVTPEMDLGVDVMFDSGAVDLVGVMGPEHGFRGAAPAGGSADTFVDPRTGLTVYDAYVASVDTLRGYITESGADTVVFDIQDVGSRFYTYVWAMYDTMIAAALTNITFVVLDRPNPITGLNAWGPVLNTTHSSYVGRQAIAQAHGMTAGELAKMFVGEGWIKEAANGTDLASLSVIKMKGWERWMAWKDTGLPWIMPSPNMPNPDTALMYPGTCLFEGTSLSEGRGTTRPFELLGAPFTNDTWSATMRSLKIPHTTYRPACFNPTTSKHVGQTFCGLQVYASPSSRRDWASFDPVYMGVSLVWAAKTLYTLPVDDGNQTASFHWGKSIDVLGGGPLLRESIDAGLEPEEIRERWMPALERFREVRKGYLLY